MTARFQRQNLVLGESGFAAAYRYGSTDRLEQMLHPGFFVTAWDQLRAGDTIRIYQMENEGLQGPSDSNRVLRYVDTTIIASNRKGVFLDRDRAIREMPLDLDEAEAQAEPAKTPKRTARWGGPEAAWQVLDEAGVVLAQGIDDKRLAEQMAKGTVALPQVLPATPSLLAAETPAEPEEKPAAASEPEPGVF